MADLDYLNATLQTKIVGANPSTGVSDNFLDVDSSGRITVKITDSSGSSIILGQTTMALSLPIAIASNQSALAVSQSGTWITGRTWVLSSGTDSISSVQSGIWTVQPGNIQNTTSWLTQDAADGPVTAGTVASKSQLMGGQFNTALPTLINTQQVALQVDSSGRLIISPTQISPLPATGSGFSFGKITTTATTQVPLEFTTYTETTTNSTMTIVSSSTSDAAAGTGARSISVTYYDQNMTGPFIVSATLNGTTPVNITGSMCYIENIVVSTVGSTRSNVGILTLKTGGAVTVGTIAATTNRTFWAHHYIAQGKTCYISGFNGGSNGASAGQSGIFVLQATTPTVANTPQIQISDDIVVSGAANSFTRTYNSPIQVVGPARITSYVTPGASSSYTTFSSFDFIDN